jgi:hypothetical protein
MFIRPLFMHVMSIFNNHQIYTKKIGVIE